MLGCQRFLVSVPFILDPGCIRQLADLEMFNHQIFEVSSGSEGSEQIALPSRVGSEHHSGAFFGRDHAISYHLRKYVIRLIHNILEPR